MTDDHCRAAALVEPGRPLEVIESGSPNVWNRSDPGQDDGGDRLRLGCAHGDGALSRRHRRRGKPHYPVILGHEMVGVVERLGEGVRAD